MNKKPLGVLLAVALLESAPQARAQDIRYAAAVEELSRMSLQELANVEVTSVSKSSQSLSAAPASIYVITHEEIIRSGVRSVPEALRLAPNLQVSQATASNYAMTARGFGGNSAAQNFANKLLILIDGRSAYSPLFSGVFYDTLDVPLDNIERIEVVSGPGAALWGANAMNGVINIITRAAADTAGTFVRVAGGNQEQSGGVRYGGQLAEGAAFRVYGEGFRRGSMEFADGSSAHDHWSKAQGGFRLDWARSGDAITFQGDAYHATEDQFGAGSVPLSGANVIGRWTHSSERSQLQVQAYFDHSEAGQPVSGAGSVLNTYDLEIQQTLNLGSRQQIIWGAGRRETAYDITNSATLLFLPTRRTLGLENLFAQDAISLGSSVKLIAGVKLEDDEFSGWTAMPDLRLSWSPNPGLLLWSAVARAIRSPTPFDVDVNEKVGTTLFLTGNPDFQSEKLTSYEIGFRSQPAASVSITVSAFYDVYDDLRTIELAGPATFLPLHWGNAMQGNVYGVEGWASFQVAPWWRLSPGMWFLHESLRFKPGASGLLGLSQAGDDPKLRASVKSSMDLGPRVTFDAFLRHVEPLPDPAVPQYYELSARLAWRASKSLELSLSGANLLHAHHLEVAPPSGEDLSRSVLVEARCTF